MLSLLLKGRFTCLLAGGVLFLFAGVRSDAQPKPLLLSITPTYAVQSGVPTTGSTILILTGSGTSSLNVPLTAAGFTVVNGTLGPGQIAAKLTSQIAAVYIWNDGSLGSSGSPANPSLAFNAADQTALAAFNATHPNFIMDGLAWRKNLVPDEIAFSQNEAVQLVRAGGGIVLGAGDSSGALIVQHVNQVASWFGFNPFTGVYTTLPGSQQFGQSQFTDPNTVNPAGMTSGPTTYSEVPHGMQPNGIGYFLGTALFGSPSVPTPGYGSPPLSSDTFNNQTYPSVNHLVTTTLAPPPSVSVLITGQDTHFTNGSVIDLGRGVAVSMVNATDATHLSAQVTVGVNAVPGVRDLTVTTGSEVVTLANAFWVAGYSTSPGAPTVTSISPSSGMEDTSVEATITGSNFAGPATLYVDQNFIEVSDVTVVNSTQITAKLTISASAGPGIYTVAVIGPNGMISGPVGLVVPGPTTTTLTASPNPDSFGPPVTLTATVNPYDPFAVNPGTVTFWDGSTQLGTQPLIDDQRGSGVGTLTTALAVGTHALKAVFSGDVVLNGDVLDLPSTSAILPFTVLPSATPLIVIPNNGQQGAGNIPVTITGNLTHFNNASVVTFGNKAVTAGAPRAVSATSLTVPVSVSVAASLGPTSVTVTSGSEVVTLYNGFTVTPGPVITQVNPNSGQLGSDIPVTITGNFTHFASTSVVTFGNGEVTAGAPTAATATSLTVLVSITGVAMLGPTSVKVTSGTEVVTLSNGFTVKAGPAITRVEPNSGQREPDLPVPVTVTGRFTHFASTSIVTFGNSDVTAGAPTAATATSLTVPVTITGGAAIGPTSVTVTSGTEVVTLNNGFTVNASTPVITRVNPNSGHQGEQGASSISVTIFSFFTHFSRTSSVVTFGNKGVTAGAPTSVPDLDQLTVPVSITAAATLGPTSVTVTTGAEVVTLDKGFTVTPGTPVITQVNPTRGQQGASSIPVTIAGNFTHFTSSSVVTFGNTAVTAGIPTAVTPTSVTVPVSITVAAALGPTSVTVTSGAEVVTLDNGFIVGGHAVLLSVTPNFAYTPLIGVPATENKILILTGSGTSSLNGPLTAAGFTVVNGTLRPGQISANLTSEIAAVYIWNDGSLGGSGSPADPSLSFNTADQTSLMAFSATHQQFIMDGLAWRKNLLPDEIAFSQNEAYLLVQSGGGIVLGAGDSSGALIVQHVNQVASWFGFNPFAGVYTTLPGSEQFGGSLFAVPNPVNPAGITSAPTTYSEVPNGLQPNGPFLGTALFGSPSAPTPGYGSPQLPDAFFNGQNYPSANHLVVTTIQGTGINNTSWRSVLITGQDTHFTNNSVIDLGADVPVSKVAATDATHLSAQVPIFVDAKPGLRNITVTSGSEVVTLENAFAVTILGTLQGGATITSITPNTGNENTSVEVTITGTGFAAPVVIPDYEFLVVSNVNVMSPTQITATLTIAGNAGNSIQHVGVITAAGAFASGPDFFGRSVEFAVPGSTTTNLSVSPNPALFGQGVTLIADEFPYAGIPLFSFFGSPFPDTVSFWDGDTLLGTQPLNDNNFGFGISTFTTTGLPLGPHALKAVFNGDSVSFPSTSAVLALTVLPSTPVLNSINPSSGTLDTNVPVTLTGANFISPATVKAPPGISVTRVSVVNSTQIQARFHIGPEAVSGQVTVSTTGGTSGPLNFTVNAPTPVIARVDPNAGLPGQSGVAVRITGNFTHFTKTSIVTVGNTAVTASAPTSVTSTSLTVQVSITAAANPGTASVTVTSGTEIVTLKDGFTVVGPPVLTQADPNTGVQGQSDVPVTITGNFTHFSRTSMVTFGNTAITAGTPTAATATSITVPVSITAAAALGATSVTVISGPEVLTLNKGFAVAGVGGSSVSYTYDSQGRLATATYKSPAGQVTVTYTYDAAGNRTSVVAQ